MAQAGAWRDAARCMPLGAGHAMPGRGGRGRSLRTTVGRAASPRWPGALYLRARVVLPNNSVPHDWANDCTCKFALKGGILLTAFCETQSAACGNAESTAHCSAPGDGRARPREPWPGRAEGLADGRGSAATACTSAAGRPLAGAAATAQEGGQGSRHPAATRHVAAGHQQPGLHAIPAGNAQWSGGRIAARHRPQPTQASTRPEALRQPTLPSCFVRYLWRTCPTVSALLRGPRPRGARLITHADKAVLPHRCPYCSPLPRLEVSPVSRGCRRILPLRLELLDGR